MVRPASETAFDLPGVVSMSWDPSIQSIVVTWHGSASSAEFMALLKAEVRLLKERRACRLLADCRHQPPLVTVAQDWGDKEWLPAALQAGLKRFAVVLPLDREAAVNVEDRLGRMDRMELQVGFFEDVAVARKWVCE